MRIGYFYFSPFYKRLTNITWKKFRLFFIVFGISFKSSKKVPYPSFINMKTQELKPKLGEGVYTAPDASIILNIPQYKIRRWISKYWEMDFYDFNVYTWGEGRERGFNFYTLMELIAVNSFREIGLSFRKIKKAHDILSNLIKTPYPFASSRLLSDRKNIFLDQDNMDLLGLDNQMQYSFKNLVTPYCIKIDFNTKTGLAKRYWPMGKEHSIVVDPNHSFGQPIIKDTNITIYSILNFINSGETTESISRFFEIDQRYIQDVLLFKDRLAA